MDPSPRQVRAAARQVGRADHGRESRAALRPRGITGVFRSRLPVAWALDLAHREGRLVWLGPETFCIVRPPPLAAEVAPAGGARRERLLRLLDRSWEVVWFALPPFVLLLAAAAVAAWLSVVGGADLEVGRVVVLALTLAAVAWVALLMAAMLFRPVVTVIGRRRRRGTSSLDQVLSLEWSVELFHAGREDDSAALLARARRLVMHAAGRARPLVLPERVVTSEAARQALRASAGVRELIAEPPVWVAWSPGDGRLTRPAAGPLPLRDLPLLLGGSAVVLAVVAALVARTEAAACAAVTPEPDCRSHPVSYGEALYWTANRLFGGDPEGLGVATGYSRLVGVLITFYGVIVLVRIINDVFTQLVASRLEDGGRLVDDFNASLPADLGPGPEPAHDIPLRVIGTAMAVGAVLGVALGVALGVVARSPARHAHDHF
jgi:hypothetical protein